MPSGLNLSQYHMCPLANQNCNAYSRFFVINSENNTLKNTSPILIHKSIVAFVGETKSIKKLNNGSLLIEVTNSKQAENIKKLKRIRNIEVTVTPHRTLNYSKGVISESEFQRDLEDLLDCLQDQKVISVRRITIKKNGQNFPTKHLILTFKTPVLPKSVKIAYINCNVKRYIPNPLRCFKCHRFGHTLTACRSKQNCARCSLPDHDSNNCSSTTPKCYNCTGEHPAYFKSCPRYKHKKEIQTVKITKNISFPEARKIVNDRNPHPGLSYSAALQPTPMSDKKANPPAENDSIVVKKSDWLALLAIKKSWEEISSNSQNLNHQTISSVVQPTVANPTVRNIEPQTNTPTNSCIANASDLTLTNSDTPLSNNSSSPVKKITKQSRENKKQEKKSNEWVKKTAAVHFCRKRSLHFDPEIKLNDEIIPFVNDIRFLGITFDRKLTFLLHIKLLRKKCEKSLNILKVLSTTTWGADRNSMIKIYKATVLSKIDYGCEIYGSARKSVLQKLDPVHHTDLRLCSGAFRTSPVQSLYVDCSKPSLTFRRNILSLKYYFRIESNTCHPFHNFKLRLFLVRLQEARKSFIPVFFTRVYDILLDLNLLYLQVTPHPKNNFPPWRIPVVQYLNPFQSFTKSDTADIIYHRIFNEHRQKYNDFIPIYTDGSKLTDHVSFAVIFPDATFSFKLHTICSVFTAEITAVLYMLWKKYVTGVTIPLDDCSATSLAEYICHDIHQLDDGH
ncbi:hypothetical protein AVEN_119220-1 [Araneus ventricosus]|uniref:CCHC-type domain-containing protein n=1 Tax=Araneus ventricosus TaxID=182803 RepID=A0A4Y2NVS5_ARAVE|nr:hypothetical protein AVEN_119220-1 [Araneus ventricosus]